MHRKKEIVTYVEALHNEVTGSSFLVTIKFPDAETTHIMVDCGLFQEPQYARLNYGIEINPDKIDAILLTHNHVDHSGGIPKLVNKGYLNTIFTSTYTKELMSSFLTDCANRQNSNISEMRKKYPNEKFEVPYTINDVSATMNLVQGIHYYQTFTVTSGVQATLFPNGHLLGASVILLQISYYGVDDVNLLFMGDFKNHNSFFNVPDLPEWVLSLPLTVVTESTYGNTEKKDRYVCFNQNIKEAIANNQSILIGAFAQGRMQEILLRIKFLQDEGVIPDSYQICVDGPLGIETCFVYRRIMYSEYYYYDSLFDGDVSFFPRNMRLINKNDRKDLFSDGIKKIVITTSGMLSHGPAISYVPLFLPKDTLIHLTGFAAKDTLAWKLIDSYESNNDEVEINGRTYQMKATIKTTSEFSSHACADELIDYLKKFHNLRFIIINHGETAIKDTFKRRVTDVFSCNVEIIDRDCLFVIGAYGLKKAMPTKRNDTPLITQQQKDKSKHQHCPARRILCKKR